MHVKTIEIDASLDRDLEEVLPKHFAGNKKSRLRVEHVCREFVERIRRDSRVTEPQGERIDAVA